MGNKMHRLVAELFADEACERIRRLVEVLAPIISERSYLPACAQPEDGAGVGALVEIGSTDCQSRICLMLTVVGQLQPLDLPQQQSGQVYPHQIFVSIFFHGGQIAAHDAVEKDDVPQHRSARGTGQPSVSGQPLQNLVLVTKVDAESLFFGDAAFAAAGRRLQLCRKNIPLHLSNVFVLQRHSVTLQEGLGSSPAGGFRPVGGCCSYTLVRTRPTPSFW